MLGPQVLINLTALPHAGIDPIRLGQGREIIIYIVAPGPPKWFGPNSIILYIIHTNEIGMTMGALLLGLEVGDLTFNQSMVCVVDKLSEWFLE